MATQQRHLPLNTFMGRAVSCAATTFRECMDGQDQNSNATRVEFRTAGKALLKVVGVVGAFCVAPPAAVYLATGSVGVAAAAWVVGGLVLRHQMVRRPRFSDWMQRNFAAAYRYSRQPSRR
jgi:hypothetical protein